MARRFLLGALVLSLGIYTVNLRADELEIVSYNGYGNPQNFHFSGRVIEKHRQSKAREDSHWWQNLWHKLKRLVNDEQSDVTVTLNIGNKRYRGSTDEEGYFVFNETTPSGLHSGWNPIQLNAGQNAQTPANIFIAPTGECLGIISDFDDTVIVSDVTDKSELLKNSLLKNYKQRQLVSGMPVLYQRILNINDNPANAPLVFLSASPKQLYKDINAFLDYHDFPKRILVTKQINGDNHDPLTNQKQYKLQKIREVLTKLPTVDFVLVGDDGESDPETYAAIQQQYPDRIKAVWIHAVNTDKNRQRYPSQQLFSETPGKTLPPTINGRFECR
jgi:phosphatidate phosphatase APP1